MGICYACISILNLIFYVLSLVKLEIDIPVWYEIQNWFIFIFFFVKNCENFFFIRNSFRKKKKQTKN